MAGVENEGIDDCDEEELLDEEREAEYDSLEEIFGFENREDAEEQTFDHAHKQIERPD